eukprot:m.70817 g.70817  ORF g.70817 m.70817 type:complete len:604 (+) comp12270_c0_seq1:27-1838(+)
MSRFTAAVRELNSFCGASFVLDFRLVHFETRPYHPILCRLWWMKMAARAQRGPPCSVAGEAYVPAMSKATCGKKKQVARRGAPAGIIDEEAYERIYKRIKKKRSRVVTVHEKQDIVLLQAYLRLEEAKKRAKSPGRKSKVDFSQTVAAMLRRSKPTCVAAWKAAQQEEDQSEADTSGPRGHKHTRFRRTKQLQIALREWLFERNLTRQHTAAKDVVQFLIERGQLPRTCNSTRTSAAAALRSVQRYIATLGWVRGTAPGCKTYREREHIVLLRDAYVLKMTSAVKERRIVYMDESYINHLHTCHHDSLYDPTETRDRPVFRNKARRYCFIAAVVSSDPIVPEAARQPHEKAMLLPETVHILEGGKQTKDYHGMFDTQYFVEWMHKLLASLEQRNIHNTIIVMDNAAYHKTKPKDTPKHSTNKADMLAACERYGLPIDPRVSKATLWAALRHYIKEHVKPIVVSMAEEAGHEVLFSPPHYSDLQPMELVWAYIKGRVGRQYPLHTTFHDVKERFKKAFDELPSPIVEGCIGTACKQLERLKEQLEQLEEVDDYAADSESENFETDPSSDESSASDEEEAEEDVQVEEEEEGNPLSVASYAHMDS